MIDALSFTAPSRKAQPRSDQAVDRLDDQGFESEQKASYGPTNFIGSDQTVGWTIRN
jgi:hypothetical protein